MIVQIPQATRSIELCKQFVQHNLNWFSNFVTTCLSDERFRRKAEALLPFDRFLEASMFITDEDTPISKLGIAIMRMDFSEVAFSLGITIEFEKSISPGDPKATIMLAACRSLSYMEDWAKTPMFLSEVEKYLYQQIDKQFET